MIGPGNGVEAAQDDHRKHLEADQGEVHVDPDDVPPDDAAERRHHAGHRPGEAEVPLDVDAHGHGDLLVVGDGAHGDALARLHEEPAEAGEEHQAHEAADELDGRDEQGPEHDGLVRDGQGQRPGSRAERGRADPAEDGGEADGRHDDGDDGPADQLAQHDPLEGEAEGDHGGEAERDRHPQRRLPDVEGRRHQDARDHHELALGEVDGVGGLVHEHEAERDQRVHEPDEDPVGHQEQEEAELVRHGRGLLPRPRSGRATGWWPGGRPRT